MNEAQLLACAEVQKISEEPRPLGAAAFQEVLSQVGKKEVFVVGSLTPVGLGVRGTGGGSRSRRRRRRAGQLLVEIGGGRAHTRGRRTPRRPLLGHLRIVGIQNQVIAIEGTSSPLRKTERARVSSHDSKKRKKRKKRK